VSDSGSSFVTGLISDFFLFKKHIKSEEVPGPGKSKDQQSNKLNKVFTDYKIAAFITAP